MTRNSVSHDWRSFLFGLPGKLGTVRWLGFPKWLTQVGSGLISRRRVRGFPLGVIELLEARTLLSAVRPGLFNANSLPGNDDGSTGTVAIGFSAPINFFGQSFNSLYVNNNGNVTFNAPLFTFTPFGLTTNTGIPIIAAFFADVDTRTGPILTYGNGIVNGRQAFGINWPNVGYYRTHLDLLNNFQEILMERFDTGPGNFDIEFNYDQIQWETGDASGGSGGFGGTPVHVGYSNGTGNPRNISGIPRFRCHSGLR